MSFSTLASALARAGIIPAEQAEARAHEIAQRDKAIATRRRIHAEQRRAARRRARREADVLAMHEGVARMAAECRERFDRAQGRVDADEIVKVSGVWTWRTGRHAGKPVGAKALAKRGVTK